MTESTSAIKTKRFLMHKTQQPTLIFEGSITTPFEVRSLGSSDFLSTAHSAETTSPAVWRQRRKGETKTLWIGKERFLLSFSPVEKARTRPSSASGGSQGRGAEADQRGTTLSRRSPWRITTTFWRKGEEPSPSDKPIGRFGALRISRERESLIHFRWT